MNTQPYPFKFINGKDLENMEFPKPEYLLEGLLAKGDIMMTYGPDGAGKSWIAATIALAIATAGTAFHWAAPKERKVLVIDGEQQLERIQSRLLEIGDGSIHENIELLSSLFQDSGVTINLSTIEQQKAIINFIEDKEIDVVILDNLSCTIDLEGENDASSWAPVRKFLLLLKRMGVATILLHHQTKQGVPRGSSTRKDSLDVCMKIKINDEQVAPVGGGSSLIMSFDKSRNEPDLMRFKEKYGLFLWTTELWHPANEFERLGKEYKQKTNS